MSRDICLREGVRNPMDKCRDPIAPPRRRSIISDAMSRERERERERERLVRLPRRKYQSFGRVGVRS